jgi:hypothetical protein
MRFKGLLYRIAIALFAFVVGAIIGGAWKSSRIHARAPGTIGAEQKQEEELPLTRALVTRSLQTHGFRSDKLKRNSSDEIVWRWLKDSIQTYPQNWVKLTFTENERYSVVLDYADVASTDEIRYYNHELAQEGLPLITDGKRYVHFRVHQGNIVCPSWDGLIDVEAARLVYFAGVSG